MSEINIRTYQGIQSGLPYADINIVIDVIRAFSVSYFAFKNGVKEIWLAKGEAEAFAYREKIPSVVLSGECGGYPIEGFDFGNSPYDIAKADLEGKTLVQKTTNGVTVTLASLNARRVFVTGYVNALTLGRYVRSLANQEKTCRINLLASHPTGREDMACARYLERLISGEEELREMDREVIETIVTSEAAGKFFDSSQSEFLINDIIMVAGVDNADFVMEVREKEGIVQIGKRVVDGTAIAAKGK